MPQRATLRPTFAPSLSAESEVDKALGADEDERERGGERDGGGEQPAAEPGGGVAEYGDGVHHRAGGDLAEGDGVEELCVGHPVVGLDGVVLHQRDDHEAAAVGEGADLECHPGQCQQLAARGIRRREQRPGA